MAKTDFAQLAPQVLENVGGEANITNMLHCATRLRLTLADRSKADADKIKSLPGVVSVVESGGQFQIVVGNDVPKLFAQLQNITNLGKDTGSESGKEAQETEKKSVLDRFISMISALITALIWPLAASGLIKAFLALFVTVGWMSDQTTTYAILAAVGDAIFYFLPVCLAITASRFFKTDMITSVVIAGALVHPSIAQLFTDYAAGKPITFLGIPVVMASYASSLIPIIVAVWLQSYLEKGLKKVLPSTIRNFTLPMIVLLVMIPATLLTFGPLTTGLANGLAWLVQQLFTYAPWLAGAVLGGLWQVFVIFGAHWGLVPIMIQETSTHGFSLMMAPLVPAVLAQGSAMVAVLVRAKTTRTRDVAGPAALSALLSGITEPGIYGLNLPLKRPFIAGCVGGAVGGVIVAMAGCGATTFVFPSLIGIPAFLKESPTWFFIGSGVAMIIGFVLTLIIGFDENIISPEEMKELGRKKAYEKAIAEQVAPDPQKVEGVALAAPTSGEVKPLAAVNDKVFASGMMGAGFALEPSSGTVVSPVTGRIIAAPESGHAYGIATPDGLEVLIHIGIDTVELGGKHFERKVMANDRVDVGDVLAVADLEAIKNEGYDTAIVTVITNSEELGKQVILEEGTTLSGQLVASLQSK